VETKEGLEALVGNKEKGGFSRGENSSGHGKKGGKKDGRAGREMSSRDSWELQDGVIMAPKEGRREGEEKVVALSVWKGGGGKDWKEKSIAIQKPRLRLGNMFFTNWVRRGERHRRHIH